MNSQCIYFILSILANAVIPSTQLPILQYLIVGGENALIEDFPYTVSVRFEDSHICGGAIVNENTIVTAAHCVDRIFEGMLAVRLGNRINFNGEFYEVESTIVHSDFDRKTMDNDIALLKLAGFIEFSDEARPVMFLTQQETLTGKTAVITGWGAKRPGSVHIESVLQKAYIEIVDHKKCAWSYHNYFTITDNMLCAGAIGKDTCGGDAGDPLVIKGYLIGLSSFGYGCARPGFPGAYVDVSKYITWITMNS